ncbi:MAG: hypothetical protein KAJ63_15475 [Methyloprofundus sp.]|nr:hypothetical protein [Methyloprofundus sp.]
MENVLVAHSESYLGQYVTTSDFDDINVISASPSAVQAYKEAVKKGYDDPVLIYIPRVGE